LHWMFATSPSEHRIPFCARLPGFRACWAYFHISGTAAPSPRADRQLRLRCG
jgi:hypothetical protein